MQADTHNTIKCAEQIEFHAHTWRHCEVQQGLKMSCYFIFGIQSALMPIEPWIQLHWIKAVRPQESPLFPKIKSGRLFWPCVFRAVSDYNRSMRVGWLSTCNVCMCPDVCELALSKYISCLLSNWVSCPPIKSNALKEKLIKVFILEYGCFILHYCCCWFSVLYMFLCVCKFWLLRGYNSLKNK